MKAERFFDTYRKQLKNFRHVEGFSQKDYALRNASWHVTDLFAEMNSDKDRREGYLDEYSVCLEGSDTKLDIGTPDEMNAEIKYAAKIFGADLVGITHFDERWIYTHKYSQKRKIEKPIELPKGLDNVIVIATKMDYDLTRTNPSALSGSATGFGYAMDSVILLSVAQYIRNLGYRAVASLNDTALAIPFAIQAGLGEYGRHGLLITREFGPRVRLGKIFTDLPVTHDKPIKFGVKEFCEVCRRCTDACPPKAITNVEPNDTVFNRSNIPGVSKWSTDAEKCFGFWANQNSDCSICIRVCPYNKEFPQWLHKILIRLSGTRLRKLILKLDTMFGYGVRKASSWWWNRAKTSGNIRNK